MPDSWSDPESGRSLPTVEVYDSAGGRVARHVNPLTPRITFIGTGGR